MASCRKILSYTWGNIVVSSSKRKKKEFTMRRTKDRLIKEILD